MMPAHKERYLAELRSASKVIEEREAFIRDPDDPEWLGVDPTKVPSDFLEYYSGLVSAGYANGFI